MVRRLAQSALWVVMAWFVVLVLRHYFNQRPLWLDETFVLNNLQHLSPSEIFSKQLLNGQAFPRTYLWVVQRLADHFDYHLLALRVCSCLCMCGAFVAWMLFARLCWRNEPVERLLFAGCWAASIPLVYYGAELKPYSMDVLAGSIFLWSTVWLGTSIPSQRLNPWIYAILFLPLFGLFSYPAFFLMVFPLYNLWRLSVRQHRFWLLTVLYVAVGVAVLAFVYYTDLRVSNARTLQDFWKDYFISFASLGDFFRSFGEGVNNLISRWFAEYPKWVRASSRVFMGLGLGYILFGAWRRFKNDNYIITTSSLMALFIFIELSFLGALHKFPFSVPRMSLFFCPFLFIAAIEAMVLIKDRSVWAWRIFITIFGMYLVYVSLGITQVVFSGNLGAQAILWAK